MAGNVVLIGLSGSGKSAVGAALSRLLGWALVDTDAELERRAGRDIPTLFAERGEAGFRALEREVVVDACQWARTVIATGGGAVLDPVSRAAILEGNLAVWLDAGTEVLLARLRADSTEERPLLAGPDPRARLEELRRAREGYYRLAPVAIRTDWLTPGEVARAVVRHVGEEVGR